MTGELGRFSAHDLVRRAVTNHSALSSDEMRSHEMRSDEMR